MTDERRRDDSAGDAAVDAAWRNASREMPVARVDAAILAAAQTEARRQAAGRRAPERPAWWRAWQPLAAAAGVAGLAFVLVQQIPREPDVRAPRLESAPQIGTTAPAASPEQYDSAAPAASAPQIETAARAASPPKYDNAAPGAGGPPAEATVATGVLADTAAEADAAMDSVPPPAPVPGAAPDPRRESATAERSALAGAAPAAAKQSVAAQPGPEEWARRIAALHNVGDVVAATTELRAFRQAHPDADDYLTPALRAWAASVDAAEAP